MNNYLLDNINDIPVEAITQAQNNGATSQATPQQTMKHEEVKTVNTDQEPQRPGHDENDSVNERHYSRHSCAELCKQPKPIPYLIKGYIRQRGLGMIYGESGCGKSFCVLDMAVAIACQDIDNWNGKPVKHAPVIYFAGEGADGLNSRLACLCNERGINPEHVQLTIIDENFKLDCGREDTEHSIDNTIAEINATYDNPALVVFDTLNVFMKGDENSNTDAGNFCSLCRKIIQDCRCSVLIVQHTGLSTDAKNRARGASAFKAAMDFVIQLSKKGSIIELDTPKIKDGKEQPTLIFTLVEHVIPEWFDEDGEPVTSCTLEISEKLMQFREHQEAEKKKPKPTKSQIFALRTYKESAEQHGKIVVDNPDTGHEFIRLDVKVWRETFYQLSSADNNDKKRVQFDRARKTLAEDAKTLYIQREGGREYYCLDLSNNAVEPTYRLELRTAIKARKQEDTETVNTDATLELPLKV